LTHTNYIWSYGSNGNLIKSSTYGICHFGYDGKIITGALSVESSTCSIPYGGKLRSSSQFDALKVRDWEKSIDAVNNFDAVFKNI
jgi:hypothetical protein